MSFLTVLKSMLGLSTKPGKLAPGDRMLACEDCNEKFVFDAGEQRFFKEKGFTDPKRCPRCRKKVRSRIRRRGRNHSNSHRSPSQFRKNSVIDGDSPYVDER